MNINLWPVRSTLTTTLIELLPFHYGTYFRCLVTPSPPPPSTKNSLISLHCKRTPPRPPPPPPAPLKVYIFDYILGNGRKMCSFHCGQRKKRNSVKSKWWPLFSRHSLDKEIGQWWTFGLLCVCVCYSMYLAIYRRISNFYIKQIGARSIQIKSCLYFFVYIYI